MAQNSWSATQYLTFEDERTRPVRDLLSAVPGRDAKVVVDLGCGPGNSTEVLAGRFPEATVIGLDSSADMIAAARKRLPELRFEQADIEVWQDAGPYDVILANAVFQWMSDRGTLLPALVAKLAPGGSLAVQMPDNLEEPAHQVMREVARSGPWAGKLASALGGRTSLGTADWYFDTLKPQCSKVDIWRTTYHHVLTGGAKAVVEWFKGSALRPFLDALDAVEQELFLEKYTAEIARVYPSLADGTVLLPFPRLFFVATR
jgi:trans-aconitate 2-methyltransferase